MAIGNMKIENYSTPIKYNKGLLTKLPVSLSGTSATLTVGGTSTFTGVATFTAAPVFNGGRASTILGSSGNTTVTAAMSGSTLLFDTAAGITFTLPAPVVGLTYTFLVTTSVTSSNHKVITSAGSVLLQGAITSATTTASVFESVIGSSNISVTMNGSTTGGLVGTNLEFKCLSATLWNVFGTNFTSSTTTTAFANT